MQLRRNLFGRILWKFLEIFDSRGKIPPRSNRNWRENPKIRRYSRKMEVRKFRLFACVFLKENEGNLLGYNCFEIGSDRLENWYISCPEGVLQSCSFVLCLNSHPVYIVKAKICSVSYSILLKKERFWGYSGRVRCFFAFFEPACFSSRTHSRYV